MIPKEGDRTLETNEGQSVLLPIKKELKWFWQLGGIPFQLHLQSSQDIPSHSLLVYAKLAVSILLFITPTLMLMSLSVIDKDAIESDNVNSNERRHGLIHSIYYLPLIQVVFNQILWRQKIDGMMELCNKVNEICHSQKIYYGCSRRVDGKNKKGKIIFLVSHVIGLIGSVNLMIFWYFYIQDKEFSNIPVYWSLFLCFTQPFAIICGVLSPMITAVDYITLYFSATLSENLQCMITRIKNVTEKATSDNTLHRTLKREYETKSKQNSDVFIFVSTALEESDTERIKIDVFINLAITICKAIKRFDNVFFYFIISSFVSGYLTTISSFYVIISTLYYPPGSWHGYLWVAIHLLIMVIGIIRLSSVIFSVYHLIFHLDALKSGLKENLAVKIPETYEFEHHNEKPTIRNKMNFLTYTSEGKVILRRCSLLFNQTFLIILTNIFFISFVIVFVVEK